MRLTTPQRTVVLVIGAIIVLELGGRAVMAYRRALWGLSQRGALRRGGK